MNAGTTYKFKRSDLMAALERVPQHVRPQGLHRLTKSQAEGYLLTLARQSPDVAKMVERMAEKLEQQYVRRAR